MPRAYICLSRNDLEDNLLQVLDLIPNVSQLNPIYSGAGQTEYVTWFRQNDAVAIVAGPPVASVGTYYGLRAYLFDCIDNQSTGAHRAITVPFADAIATALLNRVASGFTLTKAVVDALVAATCAASDLTGTTAAGSTSLGSVEELLRIMAGETYRVAAGATFTTGGNVFHAAKSGAFVTTPNIVQNLGVGPAAEAVLYGLPVLPHILPVQAGTQDLNYHAIRQIVDTGELAMSCTTGVLSKLKSSAFTFVNPLFTYGAAGTAKNAAGTSLATGTARAVSVYDAAGNLI